MNEFCSAREANRFENDRPKKKTKNCAVECLEVEDKLGSRNEIGVQASGRARRCPWH